MYIILVRGGSVNRCTPENTPAQVDLVTSQVDLVHPKKKEERGEVKSEKGKIAEYEG
jgi:hypothetical protein